MFPSNIQFVGTPIRLQQAVESLPEPKGKRRRSKSQDNALRQKLLQIETDQLRQWKLKPTMLRLIPSLARERQNAILQEKVLAIAVTSIENMDTQTLSELVPLLWKQEEFRLAMNAQFVRTPPTEGWLGLYYKAFRSVDPPVEIAAILDVNTPLYELHHRLNMQTSNPLFVDVAIAFAERSECRQICDWSWNTLLQFVMSGYPLKVRQHVLSWLLNEYIGQSVSMEDALEEGPLNQILSESVRFPKRWRRTLPDHIQNLLDGVQQYLELARWLPNAVVQQWFPLIEFIESIVVHRPSGWLCASFDKCVVVWPMSKKDTQLYVVSKEQFRHRLSSKLRQPMPFALQNIQESLSKEEDWTSALFLLMGWIKSKPLDTQDHTSDL